MRMTGHMGLHCVLPSVHDMQPVSDLQQIYGSDNSMTSKQSQLGLQTKMNT